MYLNQRCASIYNLKGCSRDYFLAIYNAYIQKYINDNCGNGSNQDNISISEIMKCNIPIPKDNKKMVEWTDKISKPYNEKIDKEQRIKELENKLQDRVQYISENEDCEENTIDEVYNVLYGDKNELHKYLDKIM